MLRHDKQLDCNSVERRKRLVDIVSLVSNSKNRYRRNKPSELCEVSNMDNHQPE